MTRRMPPDLPSRLLVTGFGPYPGVPRNPTGELARRVVVSPRLRLAAAHAKARVFETTYAGIGRALGRALARHDPDVCLHLGLAPRAQRVRIEVRAENRARPLSPDASGARPPARALLASGPAEWRTRAAVRSVLAALRRAGVPAALSRDAGAYLCNAVYALSLDAAESRPYRLVLFIHLPRPAPAPGSLPSRRASRRRPGRPSMDRLASALVSVALLLAAQARIRPGARRA